MWETLDRADRLHLMKFVCSFAWADLSVGDRERAFVERLVQRLHLEPAEQRQVQQWLLLPPRPEEVDPTRVPPEHRRVFLNTIKGLIRSDGELDEEEAVSLAVIEDLMR